ncbi:MAG: FMN-binding glutamate synthase family protein [Gammaproteobacteria bacterium]|nr:FMN-binding glutamate synthase family protein [Gammaproteobacteria bacterium]
MRKPFILWSVAIVLLVALLGFLWRPFWFLFLIVLPAVGVGCHDMVQTQHSLRRNFPLVSRGRWMMEALRPFLRQYLFESETDGTPVSRMFRSVVYQRAKGARDTIPFGTKMDTYRNGYEWIAHSMAAVDTPQTDIDPRVVIGGAQCTECYSASLLNISAMSFGSLSPNAIRALNSGAKMGGFAHNTGEGGLSPYHLEGGGDLIWQIGTGYFGCRDKTGQFNPEGFASNAAQEAVKMIEIKISQGAKPGHGGILPGTKNTPEIARIRGVDAWETVVSPPAHSAFSNPVELMQFIAQLRELSGGKPIGFKLCVGRQSEVVALCKAMLETGIRPDFITVDGGEGGTGAAPLEFSNSVGMPLRDGLAYVCDCLSGFDLKQDIKIIAVGKMFTAFHLAKNLALGADLCACARGFMLSLGCVQSLICNTNHCPTGIATQNEALAQGLVVTDKSERVARFHEETMHRLVEITGAAGLMSANELNRTHLFRRVNQFDIKRYDEIFPYTDVGGLLESPYPARFEQPMAEATAHSFHPTQYIANHDKGFKALDDAASA